MSYDRYLERRQAALGEAVGTIKQQERAADRIRREQEQNEKDQAIINGFDDPDLARAVKKAGSLDDFRTRLTYALAPLDVVFPTVYRERFDGYGYSPREVHSVVNIGTNEYKLTIPVKNDQKTTNLIQNLAPQIEQSGGSLRLVETEVPPRDRHDTKRKNYTIEFKAPTLKSLLTGYNSLVTEAQQTYEKTSIPTKLLTIDTLPGVRILG